MYLVDKEQHLALGRCNLLNHSLESLLELALILCSCNQRTHIQRVEHLILQILGYIAIHNAVGDTLGNSCLTDTCLADEYRVVLRAARENLQYAAYLLIATNDGIETSRTRSLVEVYSILAQRIELHSLGLRANALALAELLDSGYKLLLANAIAMQNVACRAALLGHSSDDMLDRSVAIGKQTREIRSTLNECRTLAREIYVVICRLDTWQTCYSLAALGTQCRKISAHTSEQIARQRVILLDCRSQDVQRLQRLLLCTTRQSHRLLQQFLRLDC